jgi:hypothetical protein
MNGSHGDERRTSGDSCRANSKMPTTALLQDLTFDFGNFEAFRKLLQGKEVSNLKQA